MVRHKIVKGFRKKYRVGTDGSYWSFRKGRWKRLRGSPLKSGHILVQLSKDGKVFQFLLHRLILETFVGPCPEGMEGCHFPDRNPANNNLSNLRWATPVDNADDCILHGARPSGEKAYNAKLTFRKARKVRRMYRTGRYSQEELGRIFHCSRGIISGIVYGKTYKERNRVTQSKG